MKKVIALALSVFLIMMLQGCAFTERPLADKIEEQLIELQK